MAAPQRHFPGSLIDIVYCLPKQVLTNAQLAAQYPDWNVAQTEKRTGVYERRIARADETAYDLALKAARSLLERHPGLADKVDAIIFCTQSPDYVMPSNAFLLQRDLNLPTQTLAFDFNLACSGFVYGILMATSFIASGAATNVLLVTADTYSKHIADEDRATRMLFGDGAAATWIAAPGQTEFTPLIREFVDIQCASDGTGWDKFHIKSGACRQPPSQRDESGYNDRIQMDGLQVLNFVGDRVVVQVKALLERNGLSPAEVDQYLLHQASRLALDAMGRRLGVGAVKVFANIERIGNTVSASIPILIKDYFDRGPVAEGSRLLLCGFGVGYSWGSLLARR